MAYVAAYMLPAAVVWGALALLVWPLTHARGIMMAVAWLYALVFGVLEILALPFRPPGLSWQVPAQWLKGRSPRVQTLIWGTALGPGLVTRNPYAGMWVLPLLLTFNHDLLTAIGIGVLIGLAHGGARALGVLYAHERLRGCEVPYTILTQWRWRVADGLLLLFVAGCLAVPLLAVAQQVV
jgi:hypothetical protein